MKPSPLKITRPLHLLEVALNPWHRGSRRLACGDAGFSSYRRRFSAAPYPLMFALATAAIVAMSCPLIRAADFLPASGNWNVPGNWSGGAVPTGSQYAYIYAGRTALAPVGVSGTAYYLYLGYSGWGYLNISGGNLLLGYCSIAEQAGIHADLTISSGSLDLTKMVSGTLWVGRSGTGTLNLSGGTVSDWQGTVGASGNGTATISGGAWNNSVLTVGLSGTGALNLNGGMVSDQYGYVGNNAGSNGSATITGGSWNTSTSLTVGVSGAGTLNLNGGTVAINSGSGSLLLASNAAATGTLNFGSTTGTLNAAAVRGGAGTAAVNFNHPAGSYTFSPTLGGTLGVNQTGAGTTILIGTNTYTGTTTISGGTLQIGNGGASGTLGTTGVVDNATLAINRSDSFTLANSITGSGSLRQVGPGVLTLTASNSYTGGTTIKSGTLAVPGSGSINHISGNLVIGDSSGDSGVLSLSGGSVSSRESYLGRDAGSSGSATITSGTWSTDQFLYVGNLGTGTLNIAGGTVSDYVAFIDSNSTATITSGNWNHNHSLYVGHYRMGTLNLNGGSISGYNGYLGRYANSHGSATITNGSWSNSGEIFVGHDISSTGTLNLDGGAVSDYHGYLGYNAGSSGNATITSGTWTHTGGFYVGWFGTGTLTLNGGTISDMNGIVGFYAGATGSATITGGTWNNDGQLYIGYSGTSTGTLNLTGGTVAVGSGGATVNLATNAGSIGTLNLGTGGSVGTLNAATVTGGSGTATVNFNHTGTYEFALQLTGKLAANHSGPGTAILTGNNTYSGTTTATAGLFQIDANSRLGTSTLTLNGGGIRYGAAFDDLRAFTLGTNGGTLDTDGHNVSHTPAISGSGRLTKTGTGTLRLTGGTSHSGGTTIKSGTLAVTAAGSINHASGDLVVGDSSGDSGALNLAGGTISNGSGWLGYESGSNGSATLTGGTWSNSGSLCVGRYGTGTLDLNGGTVSVDLGNGTVRLADHAGSTGTLNLGGGDTAGTLAAAAIQGGSGTATVNFNHAASSYTFSSLLTGTLSVNQTGPGTTILTACNVHTGSTTVSSGTLILASSSVSNIVVHSGATLGGEGTTAGSLAFTAGSSTLLFDPTTQAGALTAATAEVTGALVLVKPTGATAIGTTYTILKLTAGTFSGNPTDHFVAGPRETLAFANGNTELTLTPTIASLTWQGNTANPSFWDVTTTANWDNHGPDQFYPNDDVTFDDTASSFAVAVQGAAVTPGHIVFANSANAYSVSGGGIDGGPLTKTGTSTVTILSALSHTGGITVADGVLNLAGGNSHTGVTTVHSGTLAVTASGSINDASANMIVGMSSGDNGALNVSGGTLSDAYAFLGYDTGSTGNATVTSGT
jgi:fibronectin-binding autotransporter adhesin